MSAEGGGMDRLVHRQISIRRLHFKQHRAPLFCEQCHTRRFKLGDSPGFGGSPRNRRGRSEMPRTAS